MKPEETLRRITPMVKPDKKVSKAPAFIGIALVAGLVGCVLTNGPEGFIPGAVGGFILAFMLMEKEV